MSLSVVTFFFVLLFVISCVKTRPNYVHKILDGRVTTTEEPSPGRPKGGRGRLIGVGVPDKSFRTLITGRLIGGGRLIGVRL